MASQPELHNLFGIVGLICCTLYTRLFIRDIENIRVYKLDYYNGHSTKRPGPGSSISVFHLPPYRDFTVTKLLLPGEII